MSDATDTDGGNGTEEPTAGSLREYYDDLDAQREWGRQQTTRAGAIAGDALAGSVRMTVVNILLFVTRFIPFSHRFWRGVVQAGYQGMLKSKGGAQAVGHIMESGRVRLEPMAYKRDHEEAPMDDPRWVTSDGEWWHGTQDSTYHFGKVPVLWASARANELGNHVTAETAEVLDLGAGQRVHEDATVQHLSVNVDPQSHGSLDEAMADGGTIQGPTEQVTVSDPGVLSDELVSLDEQLSADDAGRVVSMDKYYETYPETVAPEKMQEQFTMGYMAGRDPSEYKDFVMKVMLIAAGIIIAVLLGPSLIQALLGSGGGGVSVPVLG